MQVHAGEDSLLGQILLSEYLENEHVIVVAYRYCAIKVCMGQRYNRVSRSGRRVTTAACTAVHRVKLVQEVEIDMEKSECVKRLKY